MDPEDVFLSHPHDYFRFKQHRTDSGTCFVLMPFSQDHKLVFDVIVEALEGIMICNRADDLLMGSPILERILQGINGSELIIADLTGRNPNVFYELALAHTRTKNVLLLTQDMKDVPFDLRQMFCHKYKVNSKENIDELKTFVRTSAKKVISRNLPNILKGGMIRTEQIVDYMKRKIDGPKKMSGMIVRIQASITSLGNCGRFDAENDKNIRKYGMLLEEEREYLIEMLENGAVLQAIISPNKMSSISKIERQERLTRIDRLIAFINSNSNLLNRCEFVISPSGGTNLLFFGDDILFEGYKTEIMRGFGCTMVYTDTKHIKSKQEIFDSYFNSARKYTFEQCKSNGFNPVDGDQYRKYIIDRLNDSK